MNNKVISGLSWTFAERILAQGVSFVVSIILARLITPNEYGIISIVLIFINLANVFVSNGLGSALIQRDNILKIEYSTVFWMSLALSVILYMALFLTAPLIASFYGMPILIPVVRVLSLKLILSAFNTVQHAYISKKMIFRKLFFATLGGTLVSAVVGIVMVYLGFGVWALVAQYLVSSTIGTIILQITINCKYGLEFSKSAAKELLDYGWKITASALIIEVYNELRSIIIGKKYSSTDLAYYNKGNQFPSIAINNINTAIGKVFFPVMVTYNKDYRELKKFTRKSITISSYLLFPLMGGLVAVARPIVIVLLTDKWIEIVPYLQIMCLFWITQPIQTANWQVLKAIGRSDLCVKLEILKKIIGVALIIFTMFISVKALAWSTVAFAVISTIINMIPVNKLIGYSYYEQVKDIAPITILTLVMSISVYGLSMIQIPVPEIVKLILLIVIGIVLYLFVIANVI